MPSEQLEAPLKDRAFSNNGRAVADGMIISGLISTNFLRAVERTNIPFVVSGSTYSGADPAVNLVSVDLQQGGYDATRYLIDLGHKNILFIGDISIKWFNDIYNGYLSALRESSLRPFGQTKTLSDNFYSNGYLNVEMAFEQSSRITAVFAAYDEMALGALQALTNLGLDVPRQVSVIGFDEEDYAAFTVPPLTTVKVDADALGREIVIQLYKKFSNAPGNATSVKLPTVLVKRGSCRPLSTV
jgi:LacI family transcriptional regulator